MQQHLSARADDALLSVYGTLFLTGAVAASRVNDRAPATTFLREAAESQPPEVATRSLLNVDHLVV